MEGFRCRPGPPYPSPSWGQAPALHFSFDPRLSLFGRRWLVSPACSVMTTPPKATRDCRRCVGSLLFSCESPDGLGTHDRPIILELGLEFQSDYSTKPVRLMLSTK